MNPVISRYTGPLTGSFNVPSDKSVSHRAILIGSVAYGLTRIHKLLESDDVMASVESVIRLGATVDDGSFGWSVLGRGTGGFSQPRTVLDLRNSGTGVRLLMGLTAMQPISAVFCGDQSLSSRPMQRVVQPLVQMGAEIHASSGGHLPISMQGCRHPKSILYKLPFPSAQVKSAILLAGLHAPGSTIVIEPHATRDHTEKLLSHFGAIVETEELHGGGSIITIRGEQELVGNDVVVPGDISSAAFPLVACLIVPESKILLKGVGVNPRRAGIIQTLRDMGADIVEQNRREEGREPIADLLVQSSSLYATEVPVSRVPSMIDEFPVLAVAAAYARGKTRMSGLSELRVKESDRLSAIVRGLTACGIKVDAGPDSLEIEGVGGRLPGGGIVNVNFDHRIAMAFLIFGLASCSPVEIDDIDAIQTSFPDFLEQMRKIGASFEMNQGRYEEIDRRVVLRRT